MDSGLAVGAGRGRHRRTLRRRRDFLWKETRGARHHNHPADDFKASLPDFRLRDKQQFLEMMADPRPFTDLKADDVQIRLLGDFAVIHAHMTFRTLDGMQHQGRYTDDYQRRDGRWQCVAANVIAEGL